MCYSAAVRADYEAFKRLFPKSKMALKAFFDLYWRKKNRPKPLLRTPRTMDALFAHLHGDEAKEIHDLIMEIDAAEVMATEQLLFSQRKRLADAERKLQAKTTKTALNDQRVASNKIADALSKLASLQRTELRESDSRIYPGWYAPVLVLEDGEPVIRPMRYRCRPPGMPASIDTELPGLYNALGALVTVIKKKMPSNHKLA